MLTKMNDKIEKSLKWTKQSIADCIEKLSDGDAFDFYSQLAEWATQQSDRLLIDDRPEIVEYENE